MNSVGVKEVKSVGVVATAFHPNPATIAIATIEKTLRHDLITSFLGNAGLAAISAVLF